MALLTAERETAHVSQEELARRLGKLQPYVSKVERGERRLDAIEFVAWLAALGTDRTVFLRRVDNLVKRRQS